MTCAVIVQKEEANLEEWTRWHLRVCGFDAVVMFCDGKKPELPDDVARNVVLVDAPSGAQAVQFASYNAFMLDFSARFSAAMFIDADEYLNLHGAAVGEWLER